MCEEGDTTEAYTLVVSSVCLAELYDESVHEQLADLRQLGVYNGSHGGVNWSEGQTRGLRLHNAPAEQPAAPDQILAEELWNNVFDVGHIDLVDEPINRLFESLPGHALELGGLRIVADLGLQST